MESNHNIADMDQWNDCDGGGGGALSPITGVKIEYMRSCQTMGK